MTPLESLRAQLEFLRRAHEGADRPYLCNEDLVLRRGQVFTASWSPPPVPPIPRACFSQAYRVAAPGRRKTARWVYCEGYAVNRVGLAVNHAWVIDPCAPDEAVELAWGGDLAADRAYIGLRFRYQFVREMHSKKQAPLLQRTRRLVGRLPAADRGAVGR
jgi:hypothetical protein